MLSCPAIATIAEALTVGFPMSSSQSSQNGMARNLVCVGGTSETLNVETSKADNSV